MTDANNPQSPQTYRPQPIDVSNVVLPDDIDALTETLAANTHDVWAQNRINDGWTYGATRNDDEKKHPCLVPYDQLPDSEKEYDRQTSMQTLKLIYKLGYRVVKS